MEFEFVLPEKNEDLLDSTGNSYCVSRILNEKECADRLRVARLALTEHGAVYIFDHFDVFFSIIENAKKLPIQTIHRAMELLFKSIDVLGKVLAEFLRQNEIADKERRVMLNKLKMLIFAQISLVKRVDKDVMIADLKKQKKHDPEMMDQVKWEELRYAALLQLFNLLQLPLGNLWSPPVAEEQFVNLCADFAYRTIEHPSIRQKNVEDTSFQILGTLLKNFNHSIVFPVRIFELIKSSEMSATAVAGGVFILYETYSIQTILKVIIDQILNGLDSDTSDTQLIKNISTFFTELGSTAPLLVMPFIREIAEDVLNLESYQLRICFLQLMSEIVCSELTGEELTQIQKDTRDEYLDYIYMHIQDTNAHVRSKAIGLWCNMKKENAVPLCWLSPVLKQVVSRLDDKSNLVRKNSIQLIKAFLQSNPFAAKLSIEELEKRFDEKSKELTELRSKIAAEADKADEVNENWEATIVEMKPYIIECLAMESIEDARIRLEDCSGLYQQFPVMIAEKQYEQIMLLTRRSEELNGNWETIKAMDPIHGQVYFAMLLKSYFLLQSNCKDHEEEYKKTENALRFLEDSLEFSRLLIKAVPKLQELLMSKTDSDVSEAIDFFTSAYQFGIKNTESGMRQLLFLVWSLSKDKRGPVRDAYKCIIFTTDHTGRAHAVKAVYNLIRFIENLTASQFVAFEELVKEFVETGDIDQSLITAMFEIYTKKLENVTENDSRLSLKLLVICSNAKPSIARANEALMEDLCFVKGEGKKDSRIFTLTLEFLMNIYADKENEIYPRLDADQDKVKNVVDMFRKYFLHEESECFDEVCTTTFKYIYKMCNLPNVISQELIKDLWGELEKISQELEIETAAESQNAEDLPEKPISQAFDLLTQGTTSEVTKTILVVPVTLAARFIFMLGYVAMKELIYLDVDVFSNLKFRKELLSDLKKNKKKNPQSDEAQRLTMHLSSASEAVKRKSMTSGGIEDEENNDDDVLGPSHDDATAEQVNMICDKEMLFHKESLFKRFIPLVAAILKFPKKYNQPELQRSASLALIHLMSVSSEFCEKNMPFLMNIFEHTQDTDIKCSIVIGMSDLTFRFPNIIEPWSGHLYSTLNEDNRELRLTSVRILSHLISHEMILVKGQISDLALCLVDNDDEIRKTTEVFFKEIANKSNILYNVLPDIISRLSNPKLALAEGKYQLIMKYIIGLISKDRQIEGLVEKLCYRFKVTEQERQWRDISYCLSLLTYTEKTIKKLIEHIVLFKDKVQVQEVYDYFRHIITNTSKLAKPEMKSVVQDFEMKLEECLAVNDNPATRDDDNSDLTTRRIHAAPVVKRPGRSKNAVKKPPPRRGNKKQVTSESGSSCSSDNELENQPPRRRKQSQRKERVIVESDPEETPKTSRASRTIRKVIQEPTSSDENPSISTKPVSKRGRKR